MASGRGGARENAGRKPRWKNTETQAIRVPKVFVDELLTLTRRLDSGEVHQQTALPDLQAIAQEVLSDPQVTRNGKDKGAVKRAVEALLSRINSQI